MSSCGLRQQLIDTDLELNKSGYHRICAVPSCTIIRNDNSATPLFRLFYSSTAVSNVPNHASDLTKKNVIMAVSFLHNQLK